MDLKKLLELKLTLIIGLDYADMEVKELLIVSKELVSQYKRLQGLTSKDIANHSALVADELTEVFRELASRYAVGFDEFGIKLRMQFASQICDITTTLLKEQEAGQNALQADIDEIELIYEM
jgi:hypothetical protein